MNNKRLYRSDSDRMIFGICGGLADYLNIDSTLIRLAFVLLLFLGGHGLLVYLVMALIIPLEPKASQQVVDAPVAPDQNDTRT